MTSCIPVGPIKWFRSVIVWGIKKNCFNTISWFRAAWGEKGTLKGQPLSFSVHCWSNSLCLRVRGHLSRPGNYTPFSCRLCDRVLAPCQFFSVDRRLRLTQEAIGKVASFLQRGQGKRAARCGDTACVQYVCLRACCWMSTCACARSYFWLRISSTPTFSSFSNLTLASCHFGDLLPQRDCSPPFSSDTPLTPLPPSHTLLHKCPPPAPLQLPWSGRENHSPPFPRLSSSTSRTHRSLFSSRSEEERGR